MLLTRRWDDGESLLYAANEAAEDEIETKFSYETRANEQHWTPVEFDPTAHQMPIVAVLLSDLLDVFESYDDDAMTIPVTRPSTPGRTGSRRRCSMRRATSSSRPSTGAAASLPRWL